jgi:GTP-binding protein
MAMLGETAVAFQVVLTKADLVRPAELVDLVDSVDGELERRLGAHPRLIVTSAQRGEGIDRLRAELAALAAAPGEAPS